MVWLAFSILKKVIGFAVLAAVLFGAWMVWNDPVLLDQVTTWVSGLIGNFF